MTAVPFLLVVHAVSAVLSLPIDRPVVDQAAVLSTAASARLTTQLRELRSATGAQMAVALIDSTQGEPIEDFTHRIAHEWGGGRRGTDDGLLLLLAIRDHTSRLEVGYGLEAKLPDAVARRILDDMRPALRVANYEAALAQTISAVSTRLGIPASRPLDSAVATRQIPAKDSESAPLVAEPPTAAVETPPVAEEPRNHAPPAHQVSEEEPSGSGIGHFFKFILVDTFPVSWMLMAFAGLFVWVAKSSGSGSSSSSTTSDGSYSTTDSSYNYGSSTTDNGWSSSSSTTDTSYGSSSGGSTDTSSGSGGGGDFGGGGASSSW